MILVDSHAHLDMDGLYDQLDQVLNRAKAADVRWIVTIGIDIPSSQKAVSIASQHSMIYATVGIHPHNAKEVTENTYQRLRKLASWPKVVGLGEMGLDFFKEYSPRAQQVRVFERQLEMARELDLPIVIHERAAQNEVFSMLKSLGPKELQGVIHCFSGNYKLAMKYIDLGFMISIPGIVTFKKAEILKDVARRIPLESLLLETDSPFLTPEPFRGRPNEPSMVVWTAKEIARLRNIGLEELTRETTKNVQRLFKIGK